MRIRAKELSERQRIETLDALYTAAGSIRGRESMKAFLRDLLTEDERIMLGRRVLIARRLLAQHTYDTIAADMRVGHDTVRRVHRWLLDQMPGYEQAIAGLQKELDARTFKKQYRESALFRLKKKYPGHFLLFPTPKSK